MKFSSLVELFESLERISSGNAMRKLLADFFKKADKKDIKYACYLLLGEVDASYKGVELGMAEKSVKKTVLSAFRVKATSLRMRKTGDLGEAAREIAPKKRSKLSIYDVINSLQKIAGTTGTGSQKHKHDILVSLLRSAAPDEVKYIIRIIVGQLRLGVGSNTILDGLAIAFTGSKEAKRELEHAFTVSTDIGGVAESVAKGMKKIKTVSIQPGRPVKMMLAQRVKQITDIPKKMKGVIVAEEKYDGERVQIHSDGKKIILFSRRLENITHQFPDVVKGIKKAVKKKKYIVEGEIVATKGKKLLAFQTLMKRRRKTNIEKYIKEIPVTCFLFDLLYEGNKSYMRIPYPERRKKLEKIMKKAGNITLAVNTKCKTVEQIDKFFKKSLARNCEGVICKSTTDNSYYRAGARAWQWIKWKKEYVKEMRDTFDVVVIGLNYGKGKRKGMFGALLCAVYNKKEDMFESVTKVGTGFTEAKNKAMIKKLMKLKVKTKPARVSVSKALEPDVWLEPKLVIEIEGAEITKSPSHSCGYAIRFPRFIREREDKSPEQATTKKEIMK